ncbi:MAG TPA: hypothetical protein VHP83_11980 [Aggregatilineaceae bacterium]|nr:hypothetical protein [Aggregatilineaceae bacterium]
MARAERGGKRGAYCNTPLRGAVDLEDVGEVEPHAEKEEAWRGKVGDS